MSTRRMQTRFGIARLDHGAPCFHVSDPQFKKTVESWHAAGVVEPWPPGGQDAWVGVPSMSAVVGHLAARHQVFWNSFISGVIRGADDQWYLSADGALRGPFDAVVLAVPPEQAVPILALYDLDMARQVAQASSRPCWAGLFVFEEEVPVAPHPRRGAGIISLAVCNRAKPRRSGPEAWTVHASPEWSAARLEAQPAVIAPVLFNAFTELLQVRSLPAAEVIAHRWRYAAAEGLGEPALWNAGLSLGACGDWLMGPRAECAWRSGRALSRLITAPAPLRSPARTTSLAPHLY